MMAQEILVGIQYHYKVNPVSVHLEKDIFKTKSDALKKAA